MPYRHCKKMGKNRDWVSVCPVCGFALPKEK
ncbi:DUF2180 family protein [Limibacter armeniacum]